MKILKERDWYLQTNMKYLTYFLGVFFLVSCTSSNTIYKKPGNLIPKDTMELLLVDMYLAASSSNIKDKCSKKRKSYLPFVFEKYQIDSTRFYSSNNYYTSKIEDYKDILTAVRVRIDKDYQFFEAELNLKDSLRKKKKKEKRLKIKLKDSIKEAEKSEDYIPFIIREFKIDTTSFYRKSVTYPADVKDYNYILHEVIEKEVVEKGNGAMPSL